MERHTPEGRAATARMRTIVGNWLRCDLTGEKTWRRDVGYLCFNAAGQDIGQEIISQGFALACPRSFRTVTSPLKRRAP